MKRLRRGELRDLTCPRYRVVYWESCQKHFPTPHTELCISACCYHSLLKINTNTAQTQWSSASVGARRQDDFKVEVRIGEEQRAGMIVCCDSSHKLCSPFGMSLLSHTSLPNEWRKKMNSLYKLKFACVWMLEEFYIHTISGCKLVCRWHAYWTLIFSWGWYTFSNLEMLPWTLKLVSG